MRFHMVRMTPGLFRSSSTDGGPNDGQSHVMPEIARGIRCCSRALAAHWRCAIDPYSQRRRGGSGSGGVAESVGAA
jgi:hypothetical protein